MPTVGYRPSLETTQAVGAVLLHQFARDRFLRAGVNDSLIREAECQEHIDELVTQTLLNDTQQQNGCNNNTFNAASQNDQSFGGDQYSKNSNNLTAGVETSSYTDSNVSNVATYASSVINHNSSSTLNATLQSEPQEQTYHSIQDQSLNGTTVTNATTNGHDRTLYHSVVNTSTATTTNESQNNISTTSTSTTFERIQSSPNVSRYGEELRRIAEEFERSSLREMVRNRANQVNLSDITKESFTRLLKELFQDKITREKIVILFFFCTDVALRAAEFGGGLVIKLMGWSFSYIINIVCDVVHKLGGWDKVLFYQLPSLLITCCASLAIVALVMFLKNSARRA